LFRSLNYIASERWIQMFHTISDILGLLKFFIVGDYFFSLPKRKSAPTIFFFIILTGAISIIFSKIANPVLLFFLYILFIYIAMCMYYRTSKQLLLIYTCIMDIVFSFLDQMGYILIKSALQLCKCKIPNSILEILTSCTLLILLYFLGKFFHKKLNTRLQSIEKKYIFLFLFVLVVDSAIVTTLGDFALNTYIKKNHILFEIIYLGVVIGIFFQLFLVIALIVSRNTYREKEALATQFLNEQQQHYAYLKNRERETRKFRHDLKNHMFVLTSLYEKQEFDQFGHYLETMKEKINTLNTPIQVHNEIADAILNKFYYEGKEKNISLHVQGHFPTPCKISAFDLCTILSNLLSNAMQAQTKCEGGEINIGIHYSTTEIFLTIENQYFQEPLQEKGTFRTRKKDIQNHGFGLENVKECVEKNHGTITIETEHNQFKVLLSLYNN
jgi:two-component system sensor histidine kinase AgrC